VERLEQDGAADVADAYRPAGPNDAHGVREHIGEVRCSRERRIRALCTPPKKAILVDCDDTLWGGICGEVGTDGVVIDESRLRLQRFLLAQRESGVLLCVVSRNNEADALAVFERPEMLVRREHLTT